MEITETPGGSRFPLHCSERRVLLITFDLVAVNAALLFSLALRAKYSLDIDLILKHPHWLLLLSSIWLIFAHAFDNYDLRVAGKIQSAAPSILKAGLLTSAIYVVVPFITPVLPSSRLLLLTLPLFVIGFIFLWRGIYLLVFNQPYFHRRTLVIGAGWAGRTIAEALEENGDGTYRIVGFVDDDPAKKGQDVAGKEILGDRQALFELIRQHRITTLILAITNEVDGELFQILMDCLELGVEILPTPVLYEQLTGRVPVEHVGKNWRVAFHPGTRTFWPIIKRLMDMILASFGLMCLAAATPFIAAAIYIDSPGPIFYKQRRVGKGGRIFNAYKFRSMRPDAEKGKAVWAAKNDSRVTRVGWLLRKTHVDEFPQFLNILKGEMSVVGPRSERPEFVEDLAQEIPFYRVRHAVRPGMAGWGLVKQGYGGSKEDAVVKLQYDLYYIKHQSLWLDMVILLKTIIDTLTFRGR